MVGEPASQGLFSTITLDLVSQQWQGSSWLHDVTIYQPLLCRQSGPVTILVNGGARPSKDLQSLSAIAIAAQTPIAILGSVPNQPLYGLREDALIAYTFAKYLETGDETWPLLLPMTKSVVACMDALESYFASEGRFSPSGFIITGGSKRGWTSWLAAAADPRVVGIMPMVYDNLNLKAQMDNQLATWGSTPSHTTTLTLGCRVTSNPKKGSGSSRSSIPMRTGQTPDAQADRHRFQRPVLAARAP